MTMIEEDLPVFFGDFGVAFVHRQSGTTFRAIKGTVDVNALDGYALNAEVQLRFQTSSITMREGDRLDELDATGMAVAAWRLLEHPQRTNDGTESLVILGKAEP